ncbi:MAG TPA: hypothetical protein VGW12_05265 [Pyrinomonadaceae bacterium]|nr:hypothetical protein [Pyrinomonadaceae bacterium]
MYKPNFCAECGGRVARLRWRVWTSRRFCEGCDRRFRRGRIVRPLALCLLIFGAGLVVGRALRHSPPPLVIERANANVPAVAAQISNSGKDTRPTKEANVVTNAASPVYGADGTETERPTDPEEVVSICGARTKKGTPCSRRVRGTGRCWQHRGKAAMLPAAKLLVR